MFFFHLMEEGEDKEKKKKEGERNGHGEECFPGAGPTLLAVPQVTAVR
jgi:hypothetical protein